MTRDFSRHQQYRVSWLISGLLCLFCLSGSLGLWLFSTQPAQAHALLLRSEPKTNAILTSPPTQVQLWFSEQLNPASSTVYVVNAANSSPKTVTDPNTHVDQNDAHVASNDPSELVLSLKLLPPGVYIVFYRNQSAADGHISRGTLLFKVARPDGTIPQYSGQNPFQNLLSASASTGQLDALTLFSLLMVTSVELFAVFWVGAQLWFTFVTPEVKRKSQPDDLLALTAHQRAEQRFAQKFALPTLLLLLLTNLGVLLGQALTLMNGNIAQALSPTVLAGLINAGGFGRYWLLRNLVILLAILLAGIGLWTEKLSVGLRSLLPWGNLLLALTLLIVLTFSGHAAAVKDELLLYAVLSDWLHLLAAALWVGGMLFLALIYLPLLRQFDTLDERCSVLLSTLRRFSPLAFCGVAIMALSGPFNATTRLNNTNQLLDTVYGRVLLVKVGLVLALLVISTLHVGLLRPRLKREYQRLQLRQGQSELADLPAVKALEARTVRDFRRLTTILRWEPVVGVAVLVCTGLLNVFSGTLLSPPPPADQTLPTKPFHTTVATSDKQFTLTLDVMPNRFGPNDFQIQVKDRQGRPASNVGLTVYTEMLDMEMGIEPISFQQAGPGLFKATGDLNMNGHWRLRLSVLADNKLHTAFVQLIVP